MITIILMINIIIIVITMTMISKIHNAYLWKFSFFSNEWTIEQRYCRLLNHRQKIEWVNEDSKPKKKNWTKHTIIYIYKNKYISISKPIFLNKWNPLFPSPHSSERPQNKPKDPVVHSIMLRKNGTGWVQEWVCNRRRGEERRGGRRDRQKGN